MRVRPLASTLLAAAALGLASPAGADPRTAPKDKPATKDAPKATPKDTPKDAPKKKPPTFAQKAEATREYKKCEAIKTDDEQHACFTKWLGAYKEIGSEAEVGFADAHDGATQAPGAGDAAPPDASLGPLPPVAGDVLDFCALSPKTDSKSFVKQRVIVFAPSGSAAIEDDAGIKRVKGGDTLREVFGGRFPLKRFYNIVTTIAGKPDWVLSSAVPVSEIRSFLDSQTSGADAAVDPEEAKFVAYSAACADYVAFPTITAHQAERKQTTVKDKQGKEHQVDSMTLHLDGKLGIFKRDGETFRLVSSLSASVPGMLDQVSDLTAMAAIAAGKAIPVPGGVGNLPGIGGAAGQFMSAAGVKLPGHISAIPGAACNIGSGSDGQAGLSSCDKAGKLKGDVVEAAGSIDERLSETCRKAFEPSADPKGQVDAIVTCEVRAQAFHLARSLQKQSRGVEGWQLFDVLAKGIPEDPAAHVMSIGDEEGLSVGYGFEALDENRKRIGYLKVTRVGPGGEMGASDRTRLSLRSGEVPEGAKLVEYPQLGISVTGFGSAGMLTYSYGLSNYTELGAPVGYELPKVMIGGGALIGYDLSGLVGWVETYFRAGAAYLQGSGTNTQATLIPIEATFEKGFYMGSVVTSYLALGGTFTMVTAKQLANEMIPLEREYSAKVYGPVFKAGLSLYLSPSVDLRLGAVARVPVTQASYEAKDGLPIDPVWSRRKDHFATLGGDAGLGYTF